MALFYLVVNKERRNGIQGLHGNSCSNSFFLSIVTVCRYFEATEVFLYGRHKLALARGAYCPTSIFCEILFVAFGVKE